MRVFNPHNQKWEPRIQEQYRLLHIILVLMLSIKMKSGSTLTRNRRHIRTTAGERFDDNDTTSVDSLLSSATSVLVDHLAHHNL